MRKALHHAAAPVLSRAPAVPDAAVRNGMLSNGEGVICSTLEKSAAPQDPSRAAPWTKTSREQSISFAPDSEFSKLGEEAKSALLAAVVIRSYRANDFIYLQDDEAEHIHFIRTGHIRLSYLLEEGSAILYGIMPRGQSFGELGVFEAGCHCDTATAVGDASLASIPAPLFRSLCIRHAEINVAVGKTIARRYRSYLALTRMLSLKTLAARLAQALLRLSDGLGTHMQIAGRQVAYIGPMVTQTDLGLMARGARGNVNRALKAWERAGWIAMTDRSIAILDRTKLESLAFEDGL